MNEQTDVKASVTTLPETGAEGILLGLGAAGIDYLFANAGTDFPPMIEALAKLDPALIPQPVTVPHETAGVAMAHGHYLATGRMQACMVHVNVGLANSAMGIINAASDNIPVLMMSGRTPLTEWGHEGSRQTPIQYGQEMYDQSSLVSDSCKFHYELRYPDQAAPLVSRAVSLALSEPRGPVYLSLPREPLGAAIPDGMRSRPEPAMPAGDPHPDPVAVARAAELLMQAEAPLILCHRADPDGAAAVAAFAEHYAIPVAEPFTVRNVLATEHPLFIGNDPGPALEAADLVLVLDTSVPWIESVHRPDRSKTYIHVGPDPHFRKLPYRTYATDLAITGSLAATLPMLAQHIDKPRKSWLERAERLAAEARDKRAAMADRAGQGQGAPMSGEWLSRCLSEIMEEDTPVYHEIGVVPPAMTLKGPNRLFTAPHSGGLGWALPAALGAQLADRDRLTIAAMGDGSFIFSNPVACLQIAEALTLPVLVIVKNNRMWNAVRRSVLRAYPDGAAARSNAMPLTSLDPIPDFAQIAAASRAHGERVESGADLPAALERALEVIRTERRAAVLDCAVAVSDMN